jgi:hypothetical protein
VPTPVPTAEPTPTQAPTPTQPPTAAPTTPPTNQPTQPPTAPPTQPPTAQPTAPPTAPPADQLDFTAEPNYGLLELESGFAGDPRTRDMISGGSVDASYITGCTGYATSAPDYSVRYTVDAFTSLLRFYFVGDGDTTLIVNGPTGSWYCSDDSYGTTNPTVDFEDPISGRYDIWIGSYLRDVPVTGQLSITELSINHP